jgi:HSP20 family protein
MTGSTTPRTRLHAFRGAGSPPDEGGSASAQHPFAVRRPASTDRAHASTGAAEPIILAYSQAMPPERDLFANFERMRREMDELFGDVFDRTGLAPRKRGGFSPAVDVFYEGDPPRAVVQAELAGIDPDELTLEIDGRELVLAGHRRPADAEGRVYQQLEIDFGPFRRVIQLGADVVADAARATYRDGMLRIELPLMRPESRTRSVPIEVDRDQDVLEG